MQILTSAGLQRDFDQLICFIDVLGLVEAEPRQRLLDDLLGGEAA